jgi:RNA polymerase sigma-70 factor (ECF subfamily)
MEPTQPTPPVDLVHRAQRGEPDAQRELIVAYQHRVAGFVYAIIGRSDAVEDICQLIFIKMVRAIDRLQAPSQFESWLFRLARNTCIDHLRRQKLRRIFTPFAPEHENVPEPAGAVEMEDHEALAHLAPDRGHAVRRASGDLQRQVVLVGPEPRHGRVSL